MRVQRMQTMLDEVRSPAEEEDSTRWFSARKGIIAMTGVVALLLILPLDGNPGASLLSANPSPAPGHSTPAAAPAAAPKPTPTPTPTPAPTSSVNPGMQALTAVLESPHATYVATQFDGLDRSVTTVQLCIGDNGCTAAVALTSDGWHTSVAVPISGGELPWTKLLPDGSAAVVTDGAASSYILHPTGELTPLTVTSEKGPATDHTLLTKAPNMPPDDDFDWSAIWILDPESATLRPLETQPPGGRAIQPPQSTADLSIVAVQDFAVEDESPPLRLALTKDNGRTWTLRDVPPPSDGDGGLANIVVGPAGRVAVNYTFDGATLGPWRELLMSEDSGRTWQQVRAPRHPATVGGVAYAPNGTLLLTDDQKFEMWLVKPGSTTLQPADDPPSASTITASGGVLVADSKDRILAISDDGQAWQVVQPGQPFTPSTGPFTF